MTENSVRDRAEKPKGEIGQRLDAPAREVDIATLCALWRQGVVSFRLCGLAPFCADYGLIGRLRGAFGARLQASASTEALADRPCPWEPPCAFEALWRKQGRMSGGYDHASPWTIALDPRRGDLYVTLTLFGFANDFLPAAVEAMTAALLHDVNWAGQTGLYAPRIEVLDRRVFETEGVTPPPPAQRFHLDFVSPLALSGVDPVDKPQSLVTGLGLRLEALARWHDAALGEAFARPALAERARALNYDFVDPQAVAWTRGSRRQDRAIPMRGLLGRLEIGGAGASDPVLGAALALGATCCIGADVAFGCGRYQLTISPLRIT